MMTVALTVARRHCVGTAEFPPQWLLSQTLRKLRNVDGSLELPAELTEHVIRLLESDERLLDCYRTVLQRLHKTVHKAGVGVLDDAVVPDGNVE